jgi:hypothetical protein
MFELGGVVGPVLGLLVWIWGAWDQGGSWRRAGVVSARVVGVWGASHRARGSGWSGGGECSDRGERSVELVGPWPVGGEPEGGGAGSVHESTGEGDDPVADGACGSDWAVETDDPLSSG